MAANGISAGRRACLVVIAPMISNPVPAVKLAIAEKHILAGPILLGRKEKVVRLVRYVTELQYGEGLFGSSVCGRAHLWAKAGVAARPPFPFDVARFTSFTNSIAATGARTQGRSGTSQRWLAPQFEEESAEAAPRRRPPEVQRKEVSPLIASCL